MSQHNPYQIIIIGGGIAGAVAGYYLAREGCSVLILEKELGPHHKVCGEFLSSDAGLILENMGFDIKALKATEISRVMLSTKHLFTEIKLPSAAMGVSRYDLDEGLLKKAEEAGATVKRGLRVISFESQKHDSNFLVRTPTQLFKSDTLFLATGKYDNPRLNHRVGKDNSCMGFNIHFELPESLYSSFKNTLEFYIFRGGYGGLMPIHNQRINLCFIIQKKIFKNLGQRFELLLDYLKVENPRLRKILDKIDTKNMNPMAISSIPYGYIYNSALDNTKNIFFVGDQFAVIPSFTGSGMSIAFISGKLAATEFHRTGSSKSYYNKMHKYVQSALKMTCPIHLGIQKPILANLSLFLLKNFPALGVKIFIKSRIKSL